VYLRFFSVTTASFVEIGVPDHFPPPPPISLFFPFFAAERGHSFLNRGRNPLSQALFQGSFRNKILSPFATLFSLRHPCRLTKDLTYDTVDHHHAGTPQKRDMFSPPITLLFLLSRLSPPDTLASRSPKPLVKSLIVFFFPRIPSRSQFRLIPDNREAADPS